MTQGGLSKTSSAYAYVKTKLIAILAIMKSFKLENYQQFKDKKFDIKVMVTSDDGLVLLRCKKTSNST